MGLGQWIDKVFLGIQTGQEKGNWDRSGNPVNWHSSLPTPTRPAPPMPECKPAKKDISEPVLAIIQTLKDGEWSFTAESCYTSTFLVFKHEWFGNHLSVNRWHTYAGPEEVKCLEEWMTQDEKEAVGEVCWQIYIGRRKWEKEQSLTKQRDSFMVLVEK